RERKPMPVELHEYRGALKLHSEGHLLNLDWQAGSEAQDPIAKLGARVSALHQVDGAGHHAHVDPLARRAALNVLGVTAQRYEEALPGALRVKWRESSSVGDEAQRRAVRGAPVVVRDVARGGVFAIVIVQAFEHSRQRLGREEEEEH